MSNQPRNRKKRGPSLRKNQLDELMPDEGLGDQADRAQPRNRKKRGPSLCKNQPDGKEWVVEWDEFWRPVGPNAGKYASWVGLEARQRVDILYDSWERVDDTERDELWEAVKINWKIPHNEPKDHTLKIMNESWKQFKSTLVTDYLNKNRNPLSVYTWIEPQVWEAYKKLKSTEEFKAKSKKGREAQSHNKYPHRLGSRGYSGKQKEWKEMLKEAGDSENPLFSIQNKRGQNWLLGRSIISEDGSLILPESLRPVAEKIIKKDWEVISGSFESERENDVLTAGLEKPEHTGRVRGVGHNVSWKKGLQQPEEHKRKRSGKKDGVDQIRAEYEARIAELERIVMSRLPALDQNKVPDAGSPGVQHISASEVRVDGLDLIEIPTPCDLVIFENNVAVTVAKGMVYPPPKGDNTIHHDKLQSHNVKVQVDLVLEGFGDIPLPVPNDEMRYLKNALNSFTQWPKIGVILDKLGTNDQGTTKSIESKRNDQGNTKAIKVGRGKRVSNDERPPSHDRPLVEEDKWRLLPSDLKTLHTCLMELPEEQRSFVVEVPQGEFYHDGGPILVHYNDIKLLLTCGWLDISILTVFTLHLSKLCSTMEQNFCAFLDPGRINEASLDMAPKQAIDYMCDALLQSQAQDKPFVLAPVFQRKHWIFFFFWPRKNSVFVMDPDQPTDKKDYKIMKYYNQAFLNYTKKGGPHTKELNLKMHWRLLKCQQQYLGWECGYYVMKFMHSFATRHQKTFPKYFPSPGIAPLPMDQLHEIRGMWARVFMDEHLK